MNYLIRVRAPKGIPPVILAARLQAGAQLVARVWQQAALGRVLPGMSQAIIKPEYAQSLQIRAAQVAGLGIDVLSSYAEADAIEQARPALDMKPWLLGGKKAKPLTIRHRKDGSVANPWDLAAKYVVVPLQHKPAGSANPFEAAGLVRAPGFASVMPVGLDAAVAAAGGRLGRSDEGKRSPVASLSEPPPQMMFNGYGTPADQPQGYTWQSGQYSGLTQKGGQFLTFRTVSSPRLTLDGQRKGSDPNSWIRPARPANPVVAAVRDYAAPLVERLVQTGGRGGGP